MVSGESTAAVHVTVTSVHAIRHSAVNSATMNCRVKTVINSLMSATQQPLTSVATTLNVMTCLIRTAVSVIHGFKLFKLAQTHCAMVVFIRRVLLMLLLGSN